MIGNNKQHDSVAPEHIAKCAYYIWEKEGRPAGMETRHWQEAEIQMTMCRLHDQAINNTKGTDHGNNR